MASVSRGKRLGKAFNILIPHMHKAWQRGPVQEYNEYANSILGPVLKD